MVDPGLWFSGVKRLDGIPTGSYPTWPILTWPTFTARRYASAISTTISLDCGG